MTDDIRKKFITTDKRVSLSEEIAKIKWLNYDDSIIKLDKPKRCILKMINNFLIFQLDRSPPERRYSI